MTAKTNFLENAVVDFWLDVNVGGFVTPTDHEVSLWTTDPGEDASGTEVTGNGYARVTGVTFTIATNQGSNTGAVNFPAASGGSWGTVTHVGIHNTTGVTGVPANTLLYYGALASSKTVDDGDTVSFAASALTVTED